MSTPPNEPVRELFPVKDFIDRTFFQPSSYATDVRDFRPKITPANAPEPPKPAPAPEVQADPKVEYSFVTDNASQSKTGDSANGSTTSSITVISPTPPKDPSEEQVKIASLDAPKVASMIPPSTLPAMAGYWDGALEPPVAASGSTEKPTPPIETSSSQDEDSPKQEKQ